MTHRPALALRRPIPNRPGWSRDQRCRVLAGCYETAMGYEVYVNEQIGEIEGMELLDADQEEYMFTEQEERDIQSNMMRNSPTGWAFDYNCRERPQCAAWKADPRWRRIYRFLRRGLWHGTSIEGWESIQTSKEVRPNKNGRYPMSFPQTEMSYGYKHCYMSLFDFITPREDDIIQFWDRAVAFLTASKPRVLLQLDRRRLKGKLILNSAAHDSEAGHGRYFNGRMLGCIPHLEVWYPEPISTKAIRWAYLIPRGCDWDESTPVRFDKNAVLSSPWRPDMTDDEVGLFLEVNFPDIDLLPKDKQERLQELLGSRDESNLPQVFRTLAQLIVDWK